MAESTSPVSESSELIKSFRRRKAEQMTDVEKQLLQALPRSSFYLYYPPFFHANTEICGEELHAGLVLRWSTFIIVEALLAAMAIQPLLSGVSIELGWKHDVFGMLWVLTLLVSFWGLMVTAIILGYLLHCPRKLTWIWICKVGSLSKWPVAFSWVSSLTSFLAIIFSVWVLYGPRAGFFCVGVVVAGLGIIFWLMIWLVVAFRDTCMLD